jgi:hypothetical protein
MRVGRVAWYRFRATFRRRFGGYLAIVLLVGAVGGLALGALAGARRSQSAFPSYLRRTNASDLQVTISTPGNDYGANVYSPAVANMLTHLPLVRRVASNVSLLALPMASNGVPEMAEPFQTNEVQTFGPVNGEYSTQDRVAVANGRLVNASRLNEFVMSATAAKLLGWHVGETIPFGFFTIEQASSRAFGTAKVQPILRVPATLVGIVVFNNEVVHDPADQYPTFIEFTPALTQRLLSKAIYPTFSLVLAHGAADVQAVESEIIRAIPSGDTYNFHLTSTVEAQAERAAKPESIALGVFGLIAALAALLIAIQVISRQLLSTRDEGDVLRALGAGRAMAMADGLPGVLGAIVLGAALATATGVALSPLTLIGPVRRVERSAGVSFDWTVLAVGFLVLVVVLSAIAVAVAALRQGERASRRRRRGIASVSTVVGGAAATGMPTPAVTGLRFALERGPRDTAAPVRSALLGAILAVVVVVSTLTFASGLHTLVSHPALYGWNWSYAIGTEGGGPFPAAGQNLLQHDPDVAGAAGFNFAGVQINGQTTPVLLAQPGAAVSPPILSGHALDASNEIVLGAATLAQLHRRVGDTVVVSYGSTSSGVTYVPPTPLRIVGTTTLPSLGEVGQLHVSMGTGGILPIGVEPHALQAALTIKDPLQNGSSVEVVRLRSGVPTASGRANLERIADQLTRLVDNDPNNVGDTDRFSVVAVQQPAEIVNYRTMGTTPAYLAGALAIGAVVALGLTLTASVRRRRRDLALLKALGFTRRQLIATVASQATVAALVGTLIGVPVGVFVGRRLWTAFASQIYAVPHPTVPALAIVYVAIGAVVLANLVAAVPGLQAARTPSAAALQTE